MTEISKLTPASHYLTQQMNADRATIYLILQIWPDQVNLLGAYIDEQQARDEAQKSGKINLYLAKVKMGEPVLCTDIGDYEKLS